ncbi:MAG: hypothetical protein NUV92_00895 [Ignavibacteria bacterium]|jgi:hypothetical protein|nr:hypothetical protein [Ignavibacteria bacterium]MDH7528593.1 hypothetical protein [Ignavibacteria bacterium]
MQNYNGILSLLIFCIELVLLINVLYFSKSKHKNLSVVILSLLALYQFFEFLICGLGFKEGFAVYLAFVSITFLPPTGLLLIARVNKINLKKLEGVIFAPALFFTLYYFFTIKQFRVRECSVIYASYHYPLGFLYGLFYYLPILLALYFAIKNLISSEDKTLKRKNSILIFGYLSFLLPMIVTLLIYPQSINFIESLMCKFAFVLSLTISYFALDLKRKGNK